MYDEDELLPLSGIQHYAFCPRQWALIHVEGQWQENVRTTEGRFLHERVDNPAMGEKRGDRATTRSVPLVSFALGIRGVADVVEYAACDDQSGGIRLPRQAGHWLPRPVEYKVGQPKPDERDAVQLCAQALCLEEMHGIAIPAGDLYYGKTRHRMEVVFDETLRHQVAMLCQEMHEAFRAGRTPPPTPRSCRLCSLEDICVPELSARSSVKAYYAGYVRAACAQREEEAP